MSAVEALERGQRALGDWAWADARAAFEEALASGGETPEALEGLGTAAAFCDDGATAIAARERVFLLYREQGDDEAAAGAAVLTAIAIMDFRGEPAVAAGWLQRATSLVKDHPDSPWAAMAGAIRGYMAWAFDKDIALAIRLSEEAVEAAQAFGDIHGEMLSKAQLGLVLVSAGRLADGMRLLDEATAAAVGGEIPDPSVAANVCCFLVTACARVRDLDRAAEWSRHVMEQSRDWSNRAIFSFPRSEYASVLTWWGRWDEAEHELLGLISDMQNRPAVAALGMVRLIDLRRCQGRFDEAAALLDELDARPARAGLAQLTVAARARLLLDRGEHAAAAEVAERYLRAVPPDDPVERVDGLEVLARARAALGDAAGAAAASQELAATADEVATPPMLATAARARGVTATAAGDPAGAVQSLERAVDLLDRSATPFEAARTRLDLAAALAASGEAPAALRELRSAAEAFEELGSEAWAERARRREADLRATVRSGTGTPLSDRELDVLRLIARGRSNEEIASDLYLSVRTVERHVSNIYAKLGATGRTARAVAAAYAQARDLT